MILFHQDKRFSRAWFKNYIFIILGALIMAIGYVFFIIPHKIVPGGVYGISIILHHMFKLPTGMVGLVLNIPLLIWGIRELGPRFGLKTVIGLVMTSSFIDLITLFWGEKSLSNDVLVSSLFGGVFIGVGLALVFKSKATTGGSDIVANIMKKRFNIPVGQGLILVDSFVVGLGILAFRDFTLALYAVITIFATGKVVDAILEGLNYQKAVFIISDKYNEIRDRIIHDLDRSGTFFMGKGMYKGSDKMVIFSAMSRRQLSFLVDYVREIDPKAFLTVFDACEILGEGFKPFQED